MLASRWMKQESEPRGLLKRILAPLAVLDKLGGKVSDGLMWSLRFFLGRSWRKAALVISVLVLFVLSYWALPGMGYLPTGGTNLIKVQLEAAEGTSLDENSRLMKILEDRWGQIHGVKTIIAIPNGKYLATLFFWFANGRRTAGSQSRNRERSVRDFPRFAVQVRPPIQFPLFGNIDTRSNVVDLRVMGDSYKVIEPL